MEKQGFFIRDGYLYAFYKRGNEIIVRRINASKLSKWHYWEWKKKIGEVRVVKMEATLDDDYDDSEV